jgi:hypothetical protein
VEADLPTELDPLVILVGESLVSFARTACSATYTLTLS